MKILLIVSWVVSVLINIFLINQGYQLNRDVVFVAYRAQVAADVPDMLKYIRELKSGMERHGMTRGHTAPIFKNSTNDLEKLNSSISSIITRLEAIKDIPRTEMTYQVALDDIRGTIRELRGHSKGYLWVHYFPLFLVGIGICILSVLSAVIFFRSWF